MKFLPETVEFMCFTAVFYALCFTFGIAVFCVADRLREKRRRRQR